MGVSEHSLYQTQAGGICSDVNIQQVISVAKF